MGQGNPAILLSLALTFPAVILGLSVLYVWRRSLGSIPTRAHEWLATGIACSFLTHVADNLIWFSPWATEYMGRGLHGSAVMNYGIFVNIAFRQLCAICAGYAHLRAAALSSDDFGLRAVNILCVLAHLAGVVFAFVFLWFAN